MRSEEGVMIVELCMTALIVALIGIGVFTGVQGATRGSGIAKSRSIAASLGQQDQERMRAFKAIDLANYRDTRTVTVAGIPYTVQSTARWVSDTTSASCASGAMSSNYINIQSSVTWTNMAGLQPITTSSLYAPPPGSFSPGQGAIAAQVMNNANAPVSGLPVNLSPSNLQDTTDSKGCVVFAALNPSPPNYDVSFSRPGWVDNNGVNAVTKPATVIAATTTPLSFLYDEAGTIAVSFETQVGANPPQPAQAKAVRVENGELQPDQSEAFTVASPQLTVNATPLFPFTSAYTVYAGGCAANNPTTYLETPPTVVVTPGGSHTATARVPALNVATRLGADVLPGAVVTVKPTSSGCTETYPAQTTNALGALPDPGFPYGTYQACAYDSVTNAHSAWTPIANTLPGGSVTTPLIVPSPSTGLDGPCP